MDPRIKHDPTDDTIVGPHFKVVVASLRDRTIDFYLRKDKRGKLRAEAKTRLGNNHNVALKGVHVTMTNSWIPGVDFVDIYGIDIGTGELVHERKKP